MLHTHTHTGSSHRHTHIEHTHTHTHTQKFTWGPQWLTVACLWKQNTVHLGQPLHSHILQSGRQGHVYFKGAYKHPAVLNPLRMITCIPAYDSTAEWSFKSKCSPSGILFNSCKIFFFKPKILMTITIDVTSQGQTFLCQMCPSNHG